MATQSQGGMCKQCRPSSKSYPRPFARHYSDEGPLAVLYLTGLYPNLTAAEHTDR
jgi:hypothetical protein